MDDEALRAKAKADIEAERAAAQTAALRAKKKVEQAKRKERQARRERQLEQLLANKQHQRQRGIGNVDHRFTSASAREASARGRVLQAEKREAYERGVLTVEDEALAIQTLRKGLKDPDPRIRQASAIKLLEYTKGKPQPPPDGPSKIVFQTSFIHPDHANLADDEEEVPA